jgi:hypothetical protein
LLPKVGSSLDASRREELGQAFDDAKA